MSKQAATTETKKSTTVIIFRDAAYKARSVVLLDGRAFAVEKSHITATDPALIAYLDAHADFSRQSDVQS